MRPPMSSVIKKWTLTYLISFVLLPLAGCTANYIKISDVSGFDHYIGRQYLLKNDMTIRGISLPPGYGEAIDIYRIEKRYPVDHKSPEDITKDILPAGSTIIIVGIYECTNCISLTKIRDAIVITRDFKKDADVPIKISMREIISEENLIKVE